MSPIKLHLACSLFLALGGGACGEFVGVDSDSGPADATPAPDAEGIDDLEVTSTIEDALSYMSGNAGHGDEFPLPGVPTNNSWSQGSFIVQGGDAHGRSVPNWHPSFTDSNGGTLDKFWNAVQANVLIHNGTNHGAGLNTGVAVDDLLIERFSTSESVWKVVPTDGVTVIFLDRTLANGATGFGSFVEVRGGRQIVGFDANFNANPNAGLLGYGFGDKVALDGADTCGLRVRMKAKLVVRNPDLPDDCVDADYLIQLGANYFPDVETPVSDIGGYPPGVGSSRPARVTNEWQLFEFITVDSALGVDTSGGAPSPTCHTMTEAAFAESNPDLTL